MAYPASDQIPGSWDERFDLGSPVTIVSIGPAAYNSFASGVAVDWLSLSAIGRFEGSFFVQVLESRRTTGF